MKVCLFLIRENDKKTLFRDGTLKSGIAIDTIPLIPTPFIRRVVMSDKNLARLLRAAYELEVERAPKQHPLRRPDCPPLPRFVAALRKGWNPQEREHISNCAYCQKVTAMEWRAEPPSLFTIARHLADPVSFEDHDAMEQYLASSEQARQRIELLQRSRFVRKLVDMIRLALQGKVALSASVDKAHQMAASATAGFGQMALADGFNSAQKLVQRFQMRSVSEDGRLITNLYERSDGKLVVEVESADRESVGRKVQVELIGEQEQMTAELELEDKGELGPFTAQVIGDMSEWGQKLKSCEVVAHLTIALSESDRDA